MVKTVKTLPWQGKPKQQSRGAKTNDVDQKIRKTIGWYNKQGDLQAPIKYSEVAPLLQQLGSAKVGSLLKSMEGKEAEIKNPTAWLAKAAKKAGAGGFGGKTSDDFMESKISDIKKVSKTIGWYNKQGNLQEQIQFDQVAPLLAQLDGHKAGSILRSLEGKESDIRDPTAWLAKAAMKAGAGAGGGGGGKGGGGGGGGNDSKKLSKTIGWYNKQGNLQEPIQYNKVAPLLEQLDGRTAGSILKSLEGKESEVRDPTAWLAKAALKAGAGAGGGGGDVDSKKLSKTIGWWNKNGGLNDQIMYKDVAPLLEQLGTGLALKILNSLEGKESEIKNPTAYIASAARKAGAR